MAIRIQKINKVCDGTTQQITTDTTIWVRSLEFQADDGATQVMRIGRSDLTGAGDALKSLISGQGWQVPISEFSQSLGESLQLSQFYVLGTNAGTEILHVTYEENA